MVMLPRRRVTINIARQMAGHNKKTPFKSLIPSNERRGTVHLIATPSGFCKNAEKYKK
jgi:hypothetical protein